jgi:Protein of unknown function (DUF1566)
MIARRTRRALRRVLVLAAIAFAGGVVQASAPTGQYLTFGRTDKCISDVMTNLTWIRTPLPGTQPLASATTSCADLGPSWRVPTVNELLTLVDEDPHYELEGSQLVPKAIDANAFPETPVGTAYWTSSLSGTANAWAVNFQDGSTLSPAQTEAHEVRCVTVTQQSPPQVCQ